MRPGTQPDGLVVQVILGFSGGLHGLTCTDWFRAPGTRREAEQQNLLDFLPSFP